MELKHMGMLQTLRIKNLALVEELTWELTNGFIVLTGETGAGKSVVIGALSLALGERGDKTWIRTGAEQCAVETEWDFSKNPLLNSIQSLLEQNGVEECEAGILRLKRVLNVNGQNKQFINGSPVSLQLLNRLGEGLADFHGPHDHQSLLSSETQRELLDRFGNLEKLTQQTHANWDKWQKALEAERQLSEEVNATDQQIELLRFQVEEIEQASLQPDEEVTCSAQMEVARNSRRLTELCQRIQGLVDEGESNVVDQLAEMDRSLKELVQIDARCRDWLESVEMTQRMLNDLSREVSRYIDRLDMDPSQIQEIEERYDMIQSLKRKYGSTLAEVIAHAESGRTKLDRLNRRDEELEVARKQVKHSEKEFYTVATKLSKERKSNAEKLSKAITTQLKDLGFQQARLSVDVLEASKTSSTGLDRIEFQFEPNPGESLRPLRAIASSGEMARMMLAIKTCLNDQDAVPLLIFDEVDANVGGEIGTRVGQRLRGLAGRRQVVCITHLPQVAALGQIHFLVKKQTIKERTVTTLELLDVQTRVEELARMLGGTTSASRELAKRMLQS